MSDHVLTTRYTCPVCERSYTARGGYIANHRNPGNAYLEERGHWCRGSRTEVSPEAR